MSIIDERKDAAPLELEKDARRRNEAAQDQLNLLMLNRQLSGSVVIADEGKPGLPSADRYRRGRGGTSRGPSQKAAPLTACSRIKAASAVIIGRGNAVHQKKNVPLPLLVMRAEAVIGLGPLVFAFALVGVFPYL